MMWNNGDDYFNLRPIIDDGRDWWIPGVIAIILILIALVII